MRGLVAFLIDKKCENADAFNHLCDVFNNAMKHNSNEVGILVGDLFGGHRDLATRFDESMFTSKTDQKTRDYIAEVVLNKAAFYNTMDMIGSGETVTDHERNTVAKKLHKNDLVTISCAQSDDQYTISLDDLVLAQYVDKLQERHSPRLYRKIMKVVRHQVRRENEAKSKAINDKYEAEQKALEKKEIAEQKAARKNREQQVLANLAAEDPKEMARVEAEKQKEAEWRMSLPALAKDLYGSEGFFSEVDMSMEMHTAVPVCGATALSEGNADAWMDLAFADEGVNSLL